MQNTKLIKILRSLQPDEFRRLHQFLQSPYFNRSETITELFNILADDINGENHISLKKEAIWNKLGLPAPFDDTRFRKYLSDKRMCGI